MCLRINVMEVISVAVVDVLPQAVLVGHQKVLMLIIRANSRSVKCLIVFFGCMHTRQRYLKRNQLRL